MQDFTILHLFFYHIARGFMAAYRNFLTFFSNGYGFKMNISTTTCLNECLYKQILCIAFGRLKRGLLFYDHIWIGQGWKYHPKFLIPFL